jgi:DNA-binding NtrC family response regulator
MPSMSGVELCSMLHERHPELLSIVLTGLGAVDTAIAAMRAGAYDFITKPVSTDALEVAIQRALEHLSVRQQVKRLRAAANRDEPIPGIIGASSALRETTEMIRLSPTATPRCSSRARAPARRTVARALHEAVATAREPFV